MLYGKVRSLCLIMVTLSCWMSGFTQQAEILETRIICKQPDRYIGWPTIARTQAGELLVVFSGNRDGHVCPYGVTQMIRSSDNGKTWSDPVTINNTPLDDRDAGILELSSGALLVTWFTSLAFDRPRYYERHPHWVRHAEKLGVETRQHWLGNWTRRSLDGGLTWEAPVKQKVTAPHGPIELADGRLLYVGIARIDGEKIIGVEQSADGGRTWHLVSRIPVGADDDVSHLHEPHAVELKDGKLIALIRYSGGPDTPWLRQSESDDGGMTWTPTHRTEMIGYPPHLIQLENGWLLVVYGDRLEPFGEKACISRDGGNTWETGNEITLHAAFSSDLGYPASVQLEDGSILTVYYQQEKKGEKTCLWSTHWRLLD